MRGAGDRQGRRGGEMARGRDRDCEPEAGDSAWPAARERERDRDRDRGAGGGPRGPNDDADADEPPAETANYEKTGALLADTNAKNGVVVRFAPPADARKPDLNWRLYVFKGDEQLDTLHVHRQASFLIGRDPAVADILVNHPSCSKQHAALVFRYRTIDNRNGTKAGAIHPYLIDLESTNGSYINEERIEGARFYQLKPKDGIRFGGSTREYVLMHDQL